jgi:hypothetical protein
VFLSNRSPLLGRLFMKSQLADSGGST